ncbi:hypothetical protein NL676_023617 [Syzygium grande]|nr:hypothetical protein NL676_023617 [Syzygium grande]
MGLVSCERGSGFSSAMAIAQETTQNEAFLDAHHEEWPFLISPTYAAAEAVDGNEKKRKEKKLEKKKSQVLLEGYVEAADEDDLVRTKSLTDEDLDELKGCLDLGFGFSYDEIPELCNTLPALELCYSMSQKFQLDDHQKSPERSAPPSSAAETPPAAAASPIASWKISSPGDHPEDVKARLKFWAQAVACTPESARPCNIPICFGKVSGCRNWKPLCNFGAGVDIHRTSNWTALKKLKTRGLMSQRRELFFITSFLRLTADLCVGRDDEEHPFGQYCGAD